MKELNTRERYKNIFDSQSDIVQNYFINLCKKDTYNLDLHFFFGRVCTSINKNGINTTAKIYELEISILKLITTKVGEK